MAKAKLRTGAVLMKLSMSLLMLLSGFMTDRVELRQAKAMDAAAIRDLTRQAYARWVPLIGREPKPMTADYDEAVARHRFDLPHVDGVLAALIETICEPDHLLVENVAVSPSFQGRGLGRRLMAHGTSRCITGSATR